MPVDDIKPVSLLNEAKGSKAETDPSCVAHETHVMWGDEVGRRRFFKKKRYKIMNIKLNIRLRKELCK